MKLKVKGRLDPVDRRLLEKAQDEFPLTLRPWESLGNDLGITEKEVMQRLGRLWRLGVIRRIGPSLDAKRVGLPASTLVALKVPKSRIENVANVLSNYRNVSHCYQREHEYNIWFTIAAPSQPELKKILKGIIRDTHLVLDDVLNLPSTRIFKIDVRFKLT